MWKIKLLVQFALAHLPAGERVNYLLQALAGSHSPAKTKRRLMLACERISGLSQNAGVDIEGSTVLEVGTGWNAINPMVFYLLGADTCHTYDHVRHARYQRVRELLGLMEGNLEEIQRITALPIGLMRERLTRLKNASSLEALFDRAGIVYHAPGDATRSGLPDGSVDIVYSNAVLEHVSEQVLHDLTVESGRVLRSGGIAYHGIGLHDHYVRYGAGSRVNFLKYPEWLWAFFVNNKISYTNRLREKEYLEIFEANGARVVWKQNKIDPASIEALKAMKVDRRFAGMTPEEMAVHYSEMILTFLPRSAMSK